ncbi:hypothetical protein OC834_007955, partial [Tilletia horrida]
RRKPTSVALRRRHTSWTIWFTCPQATSSCRLDERPSFFHASLAPTRSFDASPTRTLSSWTSPLSSFSVGCTQSSTAAFSSLTSPTTTTCSLDVTQRHSMTLGLTKRK